MIGGHNNESKESLNIMLEMTKVRQTTWSPDPPLYRQDGPWSLGPSMLQPRRDHACLYVELETLRGVLVTGGQVCTCGHILYIKLFRVRGIRCWPAQSSMIWTPRNGRWSVRIKVLEAIWRPQVSPLKVARTEHVISLLYGIPTVIGNQEGRHQEYILLQVESTVTNSCLPWSSLTRVVSVARSRSRGTGGSSTR